MQKHTPKLRVALMVVAIAAWASILVPPAVAENAFVEITGQTTSYADGDDGDIQAGVQFPAMRFRDNGNGTVTDRLTNLIWLKNANCFPISELGITWQQALEAANTLHDTGTPSTTDDCGLSDGSVAVGSNYGLRAVITSVAVSKEADARCISTALMADLLAVLRKHDAKRVLIRGCAEAGEKHLAEFGFRRQPGESFLNFHVTTDKLIGLDRQTSQILNDNPWKDPSQVELGLIRVPTESLVESIVEGAKQIQGLQFAPWENKVRLCKFAREHGLLLGYIFHDLLSFGFFAHSGLDGMIFHLGRLNNELQFRGLGVGLVELGTAYLCHQGVERIILSTDNPTATRFWENRGWQREESATLWQLDL
jgi:hypothetical protein